MPTSPTEDLQPVYLTLYERLALRRLRQLMSDLQLYWLVRDLGEVFEKDYGEFHIVVWKGHVDKAGAMPWRKLTGDLPEPGECE